MVASLVCQSTGLRGQNLLVQSRTPTRLFTTCPRRSRVCAVARSEQQQENNRVEFATRRLINAAVLLGAPLSLFLQGSRAHAGSAQDAIKQTDPSMNTISPPKIGDVIESGAKVAGSTMESAPPPDVGQAIKQGVKRMDVPDPLKTVLPDKNSGFNILSQGVGKSKDPNSFRNRIVDEALTDQSPRRNIEK